MNIPRGVYFFTVLGIGLYLVACKTDDKPEDTTPPIVPQAEYTADQPGEWAGMEKEHLPQIKILPQEQENNIIVHVKLKLYSESHYIEKIGIFDEDRRDLAVVSFSRQAFDYTARMTLYPIPKKHKYKVFVKCNLHDLWTTPLAVQ